MAEPPAGEHAEPTVHHNPPLVTGRERLTGFVMAVRKSVLELQLTWAKRYQYTGTSRTLPSHPHRRFSKDFDDTWKSIYSTYVGLLALLSNFYLSP